MISVFEICKVKAVNDQEDSMSDELNISLENRLMQMGLSKILIDELVSVAVRVNYGQVSNNFILFKKRSSLKIVPLYSAKSLISINVVFRCQKISMHLLDQLGWPECMEACGLLKEVTILSQKS